MKILLISDIHGNYHALEAVLNKEVDHVDFIYCLGDVIGYGPRPNECIERLKNQPNCLTLSGNHDLAIAGELDFSNFNKNATVAVIWAKEITSTENQKWLANCPSEYNTEAGVKLVHASPRSPIREYILDSFTADENFSHFDTNLCLFGHTHQAILYKYQYQRAIPVMPVLDQWVDLAETKYLINPGSVGQPRDLDPRAAYGILDTSNWQWQHRRVEYDIAKTQSEMEIFGLPQSLITRLTFGQ